MTPLKIKFVRLDNAILMKVIQQDESTRGKGELFVSSNGISLISEDYPRLYSYTVCLLGTAEGWDNDVVRCLFADAKEAKEFLAQFVRAVKEYNKSISASEDTAESDSDIETIIAE